MLDRFDTMSFADVLKRFEAAAAWLEGLGVPIGPTRLGSYRRSLQNLVDGYRTPDCAGLVSRYPEMVNALYEANEFASAHLAFGHGAYAEYARTRAKFVAQGPVRFPDEEPDSSSNRARNFAFELLIANRFHLGGLALVTRLPSDVAAELDRATVLVECKRPQSEEGVERNVIRASKQLGSKYRSSDRLGYRGVIALDLSKMSNPEFGIIPDIRADQIGARLDGHLKTFIDSHSHVWRKIKERRTIAVMARMSLMAVCSGDRGPQLTYCQQYVMAPLPHAGARNVALARQLAARFEQAIEAEFAAA